MTNTPLSSSDLSKLLIFALLSLPTFVVGGIGIIPVIFLVFGLVMTKRNSDFSHIETGARNYHRLLTFAVFASAAAAFYFGIDYSGCENYCSTDGLLTFAILVPVLLFYMIAMQKLFLAPLLSHREWVEKNGIFSSKPKDQKNGSQQADINIIGGEKFKSYSVADELLKWAKLKEDGHITEEQYNEARNKLLQRN